MLSEAKLNSFETLHVLHVNKVKNISPVSLKFSVLQQIPRVFPVRKKQKPYFLFSLCRGFIMYVNWQESIPLGCQLPVCRRTYFMMNRFKHVQRGLYSDVQVAQVWACLGRLGLVDSHEWNHYLSATSLAGGKNKRIGNWVCGVTACTGWAATSQRFHSSWADFGSYKHAVTTLDSPQ